MKIALVSCVSKKQQGVHDAENLYISDWFTRAKQYVKQNYDQWYILSAEYFLVEPTIELPYYEKYLPNTPLDYRKKWAEKVYQQIKIISNINQIDLYAGNHYRKYLMPMLQKEGYLINVPLQGLGIGEQLKWFKINTQ